MKVRDKEQSNDMEPGLIFMLNNVYVPIDMHISDTRTNSEKKCTSNRMTGHAYSLRNIVIVLLVVSIFISDFAAAMPRTMICDSRIRCLHGGTLQVPDSPFGFCTCNCRAGYAGLRCQFSRKRNRRIRRLNRLKRLVRLRNNFENLLKLRSSKR